MCCHLLDVNHTSVSLFLGFSLCMVSVLQPWAIWTLGTWLLLSEGLTLYLRITHYEVSHLELELKKGKLRHSLEFPASVCILAFCSTS